MSDDDEPSAEEDYSDKEEDCSEEEESYEQEFLGYKGIGVDGAYDVAARLSHPDTKAETLYLLGDAEEGPVDRGLCCKDEGAIAIANALKFNSTLQVLWKLFAKDNVEVDGAKNIFEVWNEALRMSSKLKTLCLAMNEIGDEGTKALAEALRYNSTLEALDIGFNSFGDEGAKAVAEALKVYSKLQSLNLQSNSFEMRVPRPLPRH